MTNQNLEGTMGDLLKDFDVKRIRTGDILDGEVIDVNDKEVSVNVTTDSIVIKPKRKEKLLDKLFENYDSNQPYPFEIVDKGGAVGEELY